MFWRASEPRGGAIAKGDRAWARGRCSSFARTLREPTHRADLIVAFQQLAALIAPHQRADGLSSLFVDQPQLTSDTNGSAGIAAALAIGAQLGCLDANAIAAAGRTLAGLRPHLTPDGFLAGIAQVNKGGDALQRGDYRVIYQTGMGLMAQIIATL